MSLNDPLSATNGALASDKKGLSPKQRWALMAVLLGVVLATLDTAIANTALPNIAADLHSQAAASIWVINAYQLAVVASMLPFASLGDELGPRRVFLGGIALFTVSSLLCTLASTVPTLAAARVLQGVGAGALMSVNIALIRLIYPAHQLGRGVGMNALVVGISFAIGPSVASLVLAVANWPWLFGINVPLGILAMAFAWPAVPRSLVRKQSFDPVTAVLTALTFAALVFTLSSIAQLQSTAQIGASALVTALSALYLLNRQRDQSAPMLPVDLLRLPMFALSTVTAIGAFATQGVAFVALPFYFEQQLHRDPVHTGLLMTAWPVIVAAAAPIAGRLSDRHSPGLLGGIGLGLLSLGMVSLALLSTQASVLSIVIRMALCGIGFGMFQAPNLKALMSSAPVERSGGASGVIGVARLLGQASGAALVALCFHIAGAHGAGLALAIGAASAAIAAITSFSRLLV